MFKQINPQNASKEKEENRLIENQMMKFVILPLRLGLFAFAHHNSNYECESNLINAQPDFDEWQRLRFRTDIA